MKYFGTVSACKKKPPKISMGSIIGDAIAFAASTEGLSAEIRYPYPVAQNA